jgi:hypothetical protein
MHICIFIYGISSVIGQAVRAAKYTTQNLH